MNSKTDGDATPLGQRPLSVLPLLTVFVLLLVLVSLKVGSSLGFLILFSVLGWSWVGRSLENFCS